MTRIQRIRGEIARVETEVNHFGSCSTAGKTDKEIAHIDERFFLACEKLEALQSGLKLSKTKE